MDWERKEYARLIQAVLALETPEEAKRFLRDLMTERELREVANRFRTAEMLENNIPYSTIEKATGFSSATVARVSKWLHGTQGGYRSIIKKLHHHTTHQARRGLA